MSAEARSWWPDPMALEEGGRRDEMFPASGVLLRLLMMLDEDDILSRPPLQAKFEVEADVGDGSRGTKWVLGRQRTREKVERGCSITRE